MFFFYFGLNRHCLLRAISFVMFVSPIKLNLTIRIKTYTLVDSANKVLIELQTHVLEYLDVIQ